MGELTFGPHLRCKKQFDMPHGTVRLHLVYWSHCEHALGWIFRWMTCGFFFRSSRVSNLAPDSLSGSSQHEMMTQKGPNCIRGSCGRKNRVSSNGISTPMRVHNVTRSRGCFSTYGHVSEALKSRIHAHLSLTPLSHSGTFFFATVPICLLQAILLVRTCPPFV